MSAQCDAAYGAAQTHTCSYRPTPAAPSRTIQMLGVIPLDVWGRSIDPSCSPGYGTSTRSPRSSSRVGPPAVAFLRTSSAPTGETSRRSTTSTVTAGVTSSLLSAALCCYHRPTDYESATAPRADVRQRWNLTPDLRFRRRGPTGRYASFRSASASPFTLESLQPTTSKTSGARRRSRRGVQSPRTSTSPRSPVRSEDHDLARLVIVCAEHRERQCRGSCGEDRNLVVVAAHDPPMALLYDPVRLVPRRVFHRDVLRPCDSLGEVRQRAVIAPSLCFGRGGGAEPLGIGGSAEATSGRANEQSGRASRRRYADGVDPAARPFFDGAGTYPPPIWRTSSGS
jgi:hypothetical protein